MERLDLTEKVNLDIARKLNALTLNQYSQLYKLASNKRDEEGKPVEIKAEFTKLKNYTSEAIKNNGIVNVKYGFTEGKGFGRLQSRTTSVQRIFNGFRGLLCNNITYDIDMKNAHPNILLNICKMNNINCVYLTDYVNNRDEWIEEMMTTYKIDKYTAKAVFLTFINKDEPARDIAGKKIKKNPEKFMKLDQECKNILSSLYEIYKNDYHKYVKNEEWNIKGKMINLLLCEIENELLKEAEKYIKSKNIDIYTRMYDGCMIYTTDKNNNKYDLDRILKKLNKRFKQSNIIWTHKAHNLELLNYLNELNIIEKDSYASNNLEEISNHMLEGILKDKIYQTEVGIVLLTDSKLEMCEKQIDRDLYSLISKQDYNIIDIDKKGETKFIQISTIPTKIKELLYSVKAKCEKDFKFLSNIWEETRFKLFFKNGYYDFKQNKFIYGQYNKTPIKIDRNYNPNINLDSKDEKSVKSYKDLYDKILNPIFSIKSDKDEEQIQLMNYFLYRMCRIMAGDIESKKFLILEGLRNSGKGVLTLLLENSFHKYVKISNSGNFIFKENTQDEAKKLSWLIDYRFSRLAYTQEIAVNRNKNSDSKIDGSIIKKFCSGGDSLEARKNFQDEINFKIQASLMICCNDIPEITPTDTYEFCDEFQMKSKFLTEEQEMTEIKIPKFHYYKADNEIKNIIKEDDIIDAFINLLFSYYNKNLSYPERLKKEINEFKDEDNYSKFINLFEFTKSNKDYLSNSAISDKLKEYQIPFTLAKSKKILHGFGCEPARDKKSRGMVGLILKRYKIEDPKIEDNKNDNDNENE